MKYYPIPPDTRGKEKIIGGIFTISQFIFLIIGVILGFVLVAVTFQMTNSFVVAGIAFIIGVGPFIPFSFVKKHELGEMELFQYLRLKQKFKKSRKVFPNINERYRALQRQRAAEQRAAEKSQKKSKAKPKKKKRKKKRRAKSV